jgi:hypothetical protein
VYKLDGPSEIYGNEVLAFGFSANVAGDESVPLVASDFAVGVETD